MTILIPRSEWGARYADGGGDIGDEWEENFLHHSVMATLHEDAAKAQECAEMRNIEEVGEQNFGQGISYTAVVFPSGRAYQGHSIRKRGAHTYGHNDTGRAICLAGNYELYEPTRKQLATVATIIREWSDNGHCPNMMTGGHRDVYPTKCPGEKAYRHIGTINRLIIEGPRSESKGDNVAVIQYEIPVYVQGEQSPPWHPLAIPPVGGSLSVPADGGKAWLMLSTSNQPATVEVWYSKSGVGQILGVFDLLPDLYAWEGKNRSAVELPKGTTGLSFRYLKGRWPVSAVVELTRP